MQYMYGEVIYRNKALYIRFAQTLKLVLSVFYNETMMSQIDIFDTVEPLI